jgi:hypothetical protein
VGIFSSRKDREAIARLTELLEKGLAGTPYAAAGAYASEPGGAGLVQGGAGGMLQTIGRILEQMPTPRDQFGSAMGTGYPFPAAPLDPAYDPATGRALPRLWQEPVGWNLELSYQKQQWDTLWAVGTQVDLVARGIVIKIDELTKLQWNFVVEDSTIEAIMADQNCTHSKAAKIARDKYADQIALATKQWENPYPTQGRTFTEWMTEFLWSHLTCDGVPVYPRYNLGREVIGFELLDPATIKVLLNDRGAIPNPPSPGFQQILYSFPRGDYQAAAEGNGDFYTGAGANGQYLRDQLAYFVRNRRTRSPYGFSVVEQCISAATLYTERRRWLRDEYTHGVVPDMILETDSEKMTNIEPDKLAGYERLLNGQLEGQTQDRRKAKALPPGMKAIFPPAIDEKFHTDYDNHLILILASILGVSPSAFGVIPRSGLGGSGERKGEMQAALTMSQKPLENFTAECINTLNRRFRGVDKNITFQWNDIDDNAESMLTKAQAFQASLFSTQLTVNDVRDENGQPPYEMPEADEPFIVVPGQGITFLRGLLGEVDESGKPIPPKEGEPGEAKAPQGEGQEGEGAAPSDDEGKTPPPGVKAELKAFGNWVRSRQRLRDWDEKGDFQFKHQSAEDAARLNAEAREKALSPTS